MWMFLAEVSIGLEACASVPKTETARPEPFFPFWKKKSESFSLCFSSFLRLSYRPNKHLRDKERTFCWKTAWKETAEGAQCRNDSSRIFQESRLRRSWARDLRGTSAPAAFGRLWQQHSLASISNWFNARRISSSKDLVNRQKCNSLMTR